MDLDRHYCRDIMWTFLNRLLLFNLDDCVRKFLYQGIDIGWDVLMFLYIVYNHTNPD